MAIEFDKERAKDFQKKLETSMGAVIDELTKMEKKVTQCRSWWKGGSEEGFIKSFSATKKTIDKKLKECAAEYKRLVADVEKILDDHEREMQT